MSKARKRFGYGHSGKLVRDKTMRRGLEGDNSCTFSYKYLNDHELHPHILNKLQEEILEVVTAQDKEEICSELADVLDVIDLLKKHNNISDEELAIARKNKHESRGGFDSKLFIEWIEFDTPPGPYDFHEYCLANPDKYPELDPEN